MVFLFSSFLCRLCIFVDDISHLHSEIIIKTNCWLLIQTLKIFLNIMNNLWHILILHLISYRHCLISQIDISSHQIIVVITRSSSCDGWGIAMTISILIRVEQITFEYQFVFGFEFWVLITAYFEFISLIDHRFWFWLRLLRCWVYGLVILFSIALCCAHIEWKSI